MRVKIGILALAMLVLLVGAAQASRWSASQIETLALRDAIEYWKSPIPCGGKITFVKSHSIQLTPAQEEAAGELGGSLSMWASWNDITTVSIEGESFQVNWTTAEGPPYNPSNFTDCELHLQDELWRSANSMLINWPDFSQGVAHELEHFENKWWTETPLDGGTLPLDKVSKYSVNYPNWTCYNEPWTAKLHHPPGATSQRAVCGRL